LLVFGGGYVLSRRSNSDSSVPSDTSSSSPASTTNELSSSANNTQSQPNNAVTHSTTQPSGSATQQESVEESQPETPTAERHPSSSPSRSTGVRISDSAIPDEIPTSPKLQITYDDLTKQGKLGGGGNADVHKAIVHYQGQEYAVALKEPRFQGTMHTETIDRFRNEAETWAKLDDHNYIVGVVDYGSEPIPWIAMEYMDGGHLGERRGEMSLEQTLWTAIAVTRGVRNAHRRGVAHLDLKPENILFRTVERAWDVPKVADWGLSKHLLEHSKSIEGLSPHYAAPEQFDDSYGPTDDITDVYQLGAVFYELFTGLPPFDGKPTQVMRAVLDDEPTPPSEVADVPAALDEILLRALAKEKTDRYESVLLMRDALQNLFDSS